MMRYITRERRVEYTRELTRSTAGCIALISSYASANPKPQPDHDPEPPKEETTKDEEEPMEEVKPQERPETEPVEGWTDPELKTGTTILQRISALLSVKSIITLAFVGTYLAMVLQGQEVPSLFENILTMIVSFFFGYQFKKSEGGGGK